VIFDFNETERRLIKILVKHLPNVRPGDAKTHLSYGQVHEMLGLTMHGKTVGVSLTVQGLGKIAEWARAISAPAITGVVVDRESSRPSAKFFELYGRSSEDYKFWMDEIKAAKMFEWEKAIVDVDSKAVNLSACTIEITWSSGVIEQINLQDISSVGDWVTTSERWAASKLPKGIVAYRAFGKFLPKNDGVVYELEYERQNQTDMNAKEHGRSGKSRIDLNFDGSCEAHWKDELDNSFDGPALSLRVVDSIEEIQSLPALSPIKNSLSLTAFLASLDCRLRIGWYWSAASENRKRVIFTIWDDQIENDKYLLLPSADVDWKYLPGAYELRRHFPLATAHDAEVFGVFCHPIDSDAVRRERQYFNEHELVRLRIHEVNGDWIAEIGEVVSVNQVRAGLHVDAIHGDAIKDIDVPLGQANPTTVPTSPGRRIIRDAMVRQYVLSRAEGKCEFCNSLGFLQVGGRRYLECHHIENLAEGGADTIDNVIAVCANDHRAAHFGVDMIEINNKMLKKVIARNDKIKLELSAIMK
jgi:5-methylcytosine-specific restriction protein A